MNFKTVRKYWDRFWYNANNKSYEAGQLVLAGGTGALMGRTVEQSFVVMAVEITLILTILGMALAVHEILAKRSSVSEQSQLDTNSSGDRIPQEWKPNSTDKQKAS